MNVKRRGIYVADLGEKVDSSVEGGIRPVLVLQNDKGNEHSTTVIIAPITSKLTKHRIPTHVLLKNTALERISIIMLEQIQTIDQSQLIEYMGEATVQERMNCWRRSERRSAEELRKSYITVKTTEYQAARAATLTPRPIRQSALSALTEWTRASVLRRQI